MTPREIALSICEPWFNGDPCEGCKCHKVCTKLVERIEAAIQVVESTEAAHIPDATKMVEPVAYVTGFSKGYAIVEPVDRSLLMPVGMALYRLPPTSQKSRQVKPVAWMVYTLDGQSAFVTDNPAAFTPGHRALPLYTAPPKREPLPESFLEELAEKHVTNCYFDTLTYAREIERLHGIGGEE